MKNNFAAFILTNGRPNNVITYKTLKDLGYTWRVVILIDSDDKTGEDYKKKYWKEVEVFDKNEIAKTFDEAGDFNDKKAIVYARNASFEVAKRLWIKNFVQLDDDYTFFSYMWWKDWFYWHTIIKDLDKVFKICSDYLDNTPITTFSFAQWGDFIGWAWWWIVKWWMMPKRKAMNSFFCSTEKPFKFVWRINEDVNTYVLEWWRWNVYHLLPFIMLNQAATQQSDWWMTGIYLDNGTYVKSFYTVIFSPANVTISSMWTENPRLHHRVKWRNTAVKIISEKLKK